MNDDALEILSDEDLMRCVANGNQRAFRVLVSTYIKGMMRYAFNMTGSTDIAEDMVQQTFTHAWKAADRWKPDARLSTWLYSILRNECLQYLRKHKPFLRLAVNIDDTIIHDIEPLPDRLLETNDTTRDLHLAMDRLPERQKTAMLLRYAEEMTQKEAAEVLGIGEKALESLLSRGKAQLKLWLKK